MLLVELTKGGEGGMDDCHGLFGGEGVPTLLFVLLDAFDGKGGEGGGLGGRNGMIPENVSLE